MSQKAIDIVRGIAQAAANAYDGALDDKGEPIQVGLKREKGHPVLDSRTMDGFKIKIDGTHLVVSYQSDIKLKDVYTTNFESEMERTIADVVKWLKKEYKKVTKNALSLSPVGEVDAVVQRTSKVRVFVNAHRRFKIGGLDGVEDKLAPSEERLEKDFKSFLEQGGWGSRPKNKNQRG